MTKKEKKIRSGIKAYAWPKWVTITLVVLSPILLTLLIFSVRVIYASIESGVQASNTASEVKKAYAAHEQQFSKYMDFEQVLINTGIAIQKIGDTKTSVCYIHVTNGGGWVVGGYVQKCYLRVTSGYYTTDTKDQALDKLSKDTLGNYFNNTTTDNYSSSCILTTYDSPVTINYVNKGSKPSREDKYDFLEYEECGQPSKVQGVGSVTVREFKSNLSVKSITALNAAPDMNRDQVWLAVDYPYFEEPIVCRPVLVPILGDCGLSREEPVQ